MRTALLIVGLSFLALTPVVAGGPLVCATTCTIQGGSQGFIPPVQGLKSGAAVEWIANDGTPHLNLEALNTDPCFEVLYNDVEASPLVRFDIAAGGVEATTAPGTAGEVTRPCLGAVAVPDGSFVVNYFCGLHPLLMRGVLVVVP